MSEARKDDSQKIRMELLSVPALRAIAEVLTAGAKKYADHNWRGGFNWSRLYGAALRHLTAHMSGEDADPETGLSHLAHLGCCVMFLLEHEIRRLGKDDRYRTNGPQPPTDKYSAGTEIRITKEVTYDSNTPRYIGVPKGYSINTDSADWCFLNTGMCNSGSVERSGTQGADDEVPSDVSRLGGKL